MADSNIFRVKIDLGNFYSDHKSKAYASVNRKWKNVRQFHRHISEIFEVKKFVLMTSDGYFLPAEENIGIIDGGDTIHVIPKNDDNDSVISAASEALRTLTEQNVRTHLRSNNEGTFKVPLSGSPSIEIVSTKMSSILTGGGGGGDDDEFAESGTNDTIGSTGSKRKRVRHRKKKTTNATVNDENQMNLTNVETPTGSISKRDAPTKFTFDAPLPKFNSHVRFEGDESQSELDEELDLPKKARIIHANIIETTSTCAPAGQFARSEDTTMAELPLATNAQIEASENNSLTNGQNKPNENEEKTKKDSEPVLEQLAKNIETLDKYKDMKNVVKQMDMIAFKVFTPNFEKSDYVIGLVESIVGETTSNPQDYDLILQIMAGSDHIKHLRDPPDEENQDIRIQINRMDIFDAKIVTL